MTIKAANRKKIRVKSNFILLPFLLLYLNNASYLKTKYDVTPIPTTMTNWLRKRRKFTTLFNTTTRTMFLIRRQKASFAERQKLVPLIAHIM